MHLSVAGTEFHEWSEIGAVPTEFDEGEYFNTVAQWLDMLERVNHADTSEGQDPRHQIRRALLTNDDDTEGKVGGPMAGGTLPIPGSPMRRLEV